MSYSQSQSRNLEGSKDHKEIASSKVFTSQLQQRPQTGQTEYSVVPTMQFSQFDFNPMEGDANEAAGGARQYFYEAEEAGVELQSQDFDDQYNSVKLQEDDDVYDSGSVL